MNEKFGYEDVLDFWYSERVRELWFASTPDFDDEIRNRFEGLWKRAASDKLNSWLHTPEGALALVIVLDQLPLNMYRGKPKSFSTESKAVEVAKHAIKMAYDKKIPSERLAFLFMPLMHSEHIEDQNLSVKLFQEAKLESNIRYAEHHREIVEKFGRFPHRNAILGRASTPAELEYLSSEHAYKG